MAKLVIEGDLIKLEKIANENRSRASKYGIKITLEKDKDTSKPDVDVEKVEKPKETKTPRNKK